MEELRRFDNDGYSEAPKKRRKSRRPRWLRLAQTGDFAQTWQERKTSDEDNEEVDDSAENPTPFNKKIRKFWRRLFPKITQTERPRLPNLAPAETEVGNPPSASPKSEETNNFATPDQPESKPVVEDTNEPVLPPASVGGSARPPRRPPGGQGLPPSPDAVPGADLAVAETAFQRIAQQEAAAARRDTLRTAVGAAVALDILDPIGRWRENRKDRKTLARANRSADQKLKPLQEFGQKVRQDLAEQGAKINKMQAEYMRQPLPPAAEKASAKPETVVSVTTHERPVTLRPEQTISLSAEPFVAKQPLTPEQNASSPEVVLKEVQKAAEKGVPLEALFERRHEIKDQTKQGGVASALGARLLAQSGQWSDISADDNVKASKRAATTTVKAAVVSHKTAHRRGTLGLLALILLIIMWLMLK